MWRKLLCSATSAVLLGYPSTPARAATNDVIVFQQQSAACLARLREIDEAVVKLEQTIGADQTTLTDCVRSRELKIKGLIELTQEMQLQIRTVTSDEAASEFGDLKSGCERAEKLLLEAQDCISNSPPQTAITNEAPVVTNAPATPVEIKITPRSLPRTIPHTFVERTAQTCLHQEQFAAMLARAMGLKIDPRTTSIDRTAVLAKLSVEPLGGWHAAKCVTVDDVYVACAKAMGLKVKDSADPLSYGEALREEGLGVDALLPARDPKADPPFVLESEVRSFLASGYAGSLSGGKPITAE